MSDVPAPTTFDFWGCSIDASWIDRRSAAYLARFAASSPPGVETIWREMDRVWREMGLSNKGPQDPARVEAFYRHPVWILNGIFTATDPVSVSHRIAISKIATRLNAGSVADYGGGMGELGVCIAEANSNCRVDVVEPFSTSIALARAANHPGIVFVRELRAGYDVVIAQDVLEHVEDPIGLAARLSEATRPGGHLIFANCFFPVIECHLPGTFHLRHTFPWVMAMSGLEYLGCVPGAEHAQLFRKRGEVRIDALRRRESWSRAIGPLASKARALASRLLVASGLIRRHMTP